MHPVTPKVFCVGETAINYLELNAYLTEIGAEGWETNAHSDIEELIEVESRGCYMSFKHEDGSYSNLNLTRSRDGNDVHLEHLLKVGHGSTMEHPVVNFQITNVSRIFTHELVRHRSGTAVSQESMRFVRLTDVGFWVPGCWDGVEDEATRIYRESVEASERAYQQLLALAAAKEGVESFDDLQFSKKKVYTSAARRIAPDGLATNIGWSCNMRALRHVLEMRTDPGAEEEIRYVFNIIGFMAMDKWPNLFGDYEPVLVDGYYHFITEHRKV